METEDCAVILQVIIKFLFLCVSVGVREGMSQAGYHWEDKAFHPWMHRLYHGTRILSTGLSI